MCTTNDNHMMYGSWDMERNGQSFFLILDHFLPFYPTNNPKNQIFETMEKIPGDIIILYMCTINENHMMYGSWDMECDWQTFLPFWNVFCHFNLLMMQKIKILKKWKKRLEILQF